MKYSGSLQRSAGSLLVLIVLTAAVAGSAGCASIRPGAGGEHVVRTLWQTSDQYVAVEKQDRAADGAAAANDHPADVSAGRIRDMLASVAVRASGTDPAVRLFNDDELAVLGGQIRAGLAMAGPDEDVTFAIIGHHTAFAGLLKQRMITLGRVFCRGGELNLIVGDVLREVNDKEDRRLHPLLQGSRKGSGPREPALTVIPGKENYIMKRPDWVIFPVAGPVSAAPMPAAPEQNEAPTRQIREPRTGTAGEKPAGAGRRSIEERLMMLNDLKDRKLVTDEEYRAKRREILDEI